MSTTAKRVLQNSVLRVGGYAIGALIYFAIVVLIARYLGTEGFGYFSFILAFAGVFQLLADLGVCGGLIVYSALPLVLQTFTRDELIQLTDAMRVRFRIPVR